MMLPFMHLVERLKTTRRTGWIERSVHAPESIADHMYRMSLLALTLPPGVANGQRCVGICLVHDLVEAVAGDIRYVCC